MGRPAITRWKEASSAQLTRYMGTLWKPLFVFILFAIAICVTGFLVFLHYEEGVKKDKQDELSAISQLKIAQITSWISERKDDAHILVKDPWFLREFESWIQKGGPTDESRLKLMERLAALQQNYAVYGYTSVAVFDSKVIQRLSTLRDDGPLQAHEKEEMLESMRTGRIVLSDIHAEKHGNKQVVEMDLVAPIMVSRHGKSQAIGAVLLHTDPNLFLFPLVKSWPTPSPSAENLLVRREGNEVVYLNELRHRKNTALAMRFPISMEDLPAAKAARGQNGMVEGVDYRGVPVVGALNKIPGTPWLMVSKVDQAEIYASIRNQANLMLMLMLTFIGVGGGLALYWREKEKKQYEAELNHQLLVKHLNYLTRYANDIILLVDDAGNIIEFNDRALDAYGYGAEELSIMNVFDLRKIEYVSQSREDLRRIHEAGALRFETMHKRKNGEEFPVEASVRVVEIEGKKFQQAIIRDISVRKKAEEGLQRLNRSLMLLSECNAAMVRINKESCLLTEICKLAVETGGYRMAWVGFAEEVGDMPVRPEARYGHDEGYLDSVCIRSANNEHGRGPTGTAIRTGETQVNPDFETNASTAPWREAALARGYRSSIALPLKGNGKVFWVFTIYSAETNAFNADETKLLEELAANMAYGISSIRIGNERKQVETQLENERTRLRTLVQTIPDLVWLKDPDGVFLSCNPQFERFLGAKEADIVGKTDYDFQEKDLADFFRQKDREAMQADSPRVNEEWIIYPDTGQRALLETIKVPMRDEQGKLIGVMGIARDITERKNFEEELRFKNTLLTTEHEASIDGIMIVNDKGIILSYNRRFFEIWRADKAEVTGADGRVLQTMLEQLKEPQQFIEKMIHLYEHRTETDRAEIELIDGRVLDLYTAPMNGPLEQYYGRIWYFHDITEQKQAAKKLAESYAQLQRLSLHIDSVKAEERARIALNLHDEMGATLAAMKMRVAWLASKLPAAGAENLAEEAAHISELVSGGIKTMHKIVSELQPPLMGDVGLVESIGNYVNKFSHHTHIACTLDLPEEKFRVDADQSMTILRILQESLSNVAKHSTASEVNIQLVERSESLLLEVKDNGVGFDASAHKVRSFGLLGIRERALMVGGKARIISMPGKGTRVSVSIPLCSAEPGAAEIA